MIRGERHVWVAVLGPVLDGKRAVLAAADYGDQNGEVLAVGLADGEGACEALGCFECCNDASGMATCTGGPRAGDRARRARFGAPSPVRAVI